MSNVKGNDIDDLFKRASDQYPLRTDSADWNKLAADLDKDRSLIIPPANTEGGGKRKRRRFFWLFLLLPLGGIGYYAVQSSKQSQATVQHGAPETSAKAGGDQAGTAQAVPSGKGSNPQDAASAGTPAPESGVNKPTTESGKNAPANESGQKSTTPETGKNLPASESGQKSTTPETGKNTPAPESTGKTPATAGAPSGTPASVGTASRKQAPAGTPSGTSVRETPATPASVYSADQKDNSARKNHTNENARKNHKGESNSQINPSVLASHPPTGSGLSGGQTINRQLTNRSSTEGQITGKRKRKSQVTGQPGSEEQGAVGRTTADVSSNGRQTTPTSGIGKQTNGIPIDKAKQKSGTPPGVVAQENTTPSDLTLGNRGTTTEERDLSLSALKSSRARTSGDVSLNIPVNAKPITVAAKDSSGLKKGTKNKKESFFYAGLIVAPDLSTIKMQSVKGVGTTFGILLGYQFNRRWAVETGVYLDRKKYYSDAEYFNKKNTPGLNGVDLVSLTGVCNMVEIPVNLRYNISNGSRTKWFATTGLSTYLMSRENYTFSIDRNNPWDETWEYHKHYNNWFSIINLSLGFEQKLGKIGNLRIEPYARIPLSGIGTGSLPIMSAGLNIGITRRIW